MLVKNHPNAMKNQTVVSGTPVPAQSSKRAGRATTAARQVEHAEGQRTVAMDLKHRALECWENEGGAEFEIDVAATQTENSKAIAGQEEADTLLRRVIDAIASEETG